MICGQVRNAGAPSYQVWDGLEVRGSARSPTHDHHRFADVDPAEPWRAGSRRSQRRRLEGVEPSESQDRHRSRRRRRPPIDQSTSFPGQKERTRRRSGGSPSPPDPHRVRGAVGLEAWCTCRHAATCRPGLPTALHASWSNGRRSGTGTPRCATPSLGGQRGVVGAVGDVTPGHGRRVGARVVPGDVRCRICPRATTAASYDDGITSLMSWKKYTRSA